MLSSHLYVPNMMLNCLREKTLCVHPKYEHAAGCKKGKGSHALNCLIFQLCWQSERSKVVGSFFFSRSVIGEEYRLAFKLLWEIGY